MSLQGLAVNATRPRPPKLDEVTMYQGTTAEIVLPVEDESEWAGSHWQQASIGQTDMDAGGNVLKYTPPKDFVGTAVVSMKAFDGEAATELIVHVVEAPPGQDYSGVHEVVMPPVNADVAAALAAEVADSLPEAARNRLGEPTRQEVTMYQGMSAQLTLTADDGNEDTLKVKDATASCGECAVDGNVLTYTPPGDFVGTGVVHYSASSGGKSDQYKALVVHVVAPPPGREGKSGVQQVALPSLDHAAAGAAIQAASIARQANAAHQGEVTMYQGTTGEISFSSSDPNDKMWSGWHATHASVGITKMERDSNVLAYTPPEHFVGTAVVSLKTHDEKEDYELIVHVVDVPSGQAKKSGMQQLGVPSPSQQAASAALIAAAASECPEAAREQLKAGKTPIVTMFKV